MAIRNDYLLDMVEQFTADVLDGLRKARRGFPRDGIGEFEGIVGSVLDMEPATALALSPASLVTMMRLSAVDESLAEYAVYALERASELYAAQGDATAGLRHEQACAVAQSYGFALTAVPLHLERALGLQDDMP